MRPETIERRANSEAHRDAAHRIAIACAERHNFDYDAAAAEADKHAAGGDPFARDAAIMLHRRADTLASAATRRIG